MIAESLSFMLSPPLVLARVEQRPEPFGDRLSRTEYPRSDGPDRAAHDRGDILVAQAFKLAQRNGIAQFLGQLPERIVDGPRDLRRHQHALGRVDIAQLIAVLEALGVLGIELG